MGLLGADDGESAGRIGHADDTDDATVKDSRYGGINLEVPGT